MIYYHVSTDLKKDTHFYPRQPESIMEGEMVSIDRVCVAPSVEQCLSALPSGGSRLDELNEKQHGFYKVFRIDTEKLGIPDSNIVTWKTLFEKEYVPDAEWTEEHWITTDFTVAEEDTFIIQLLQWEEEVQDVIPHKIYVLADEKYHGDYTSAYIQETGNLVPCTSLITNAKIQTEGFQVGDPITFVSEMLEDEDIKNIIRSIEMEHSCTLNHTAYLECQLTSGELGLIELAETLHKPYSVYEALGTK